ncbi:MAG: TIGR04219 family outer membrane beta-barrel protein [Desulfobacteraceae bacterium]|jgi:outer membrane protein
MFRKLWYAILIVACITVSQPYAAGLEVAIGGWQQSLGGSLGYEALSATDILDLENDLGFDDENRMIGRINIDTPIFFPNIYLAGAPAEFEGTGSKSIAFNFGDTTYNADTVLTSKITINQYDVGLYYGLPFIKTASAGKFNIDVGLNLRILDLEASLSGLSGAVTVQEKESITLPVPMLYLAFQIMPTDSFSIEAEGRGVAIGDNKLYSLIGRLRYQFAGPVFIAGGYRLDQLDVDEEDVEADVDLGGAFVELGLKF